MLYILYELRMSVVVKPSLRLCHPLGIDPRRAHYCDDFPFFPLEKLIVVSDFERISCEHNKQSEYYILALSMCTMRKKTAYRHVWQRSVSENILQIHPTLALRPSSAITHDTNGSVETTIFNTDTSFMKPHFHCNQRALSSFYSHTISPSPSTHQTIQQFRTQCTQRV